MGWLKLLRRAVEGCRRWLAIQEPRRPRYPVPAKYSPQVTAYAQAGLDKLLAAVKAHPGEMEKPSQGELKLVIKPKPESFFDHLNAAQKQSLEQEIRKQQFWWHCGHSARERRMASRAGRN